MRKHLLEAIELNKNRMPKYASLTQGKSIRFSKRLILLERLSIPTALYFDIIGSYFQKRGIPFIKEEFIDMSLTPSFSQTFPDEIDYTKKIEKISIIAFKREVKSLLKNKNWDKLITTCEEFLSLLEDQPQYYCMLRHIIESFARTAYLAPLHHQRAITKGKRSPLGHSILLLKMHLTMLNTTIKLDEQCSFIQHNGVPFIYQDVPPIPIICNYNLSKD